MDAFLYLYHTQPDQLIGYDELSAEDLMDSIQMHWQDKREFLKHHKTKLISSDNPQIVVVYCTIVGEAVPEAEATIATNPITAYKYASTVLHGRFKKGEPIMATDGHCSFMYATRTLNSRFIEGEPEIREDGALWASYCIYFGIKE